MKTILKVYLISVLVMLSFGNNNLFAVHRTQFKTCSAILNDLKMDTLLNNSNNLKNNDELILLKSYKDDHHLYFSDIAGSVDNTYTRISHAKPGTHNTPQTLENINQLPFSENFNEITFPPAGWKIDHLASQWSRSISTKAGGEIAEAKFSYINQIDTTRLISPVFDLSSFTNLIFRFKHFYDYYTQGVTIGLATRTANANWTTQWQANPTGNIGPEEVFVELTSFNADDVQFCFFLQGNLYNADYWYIDDIGLFELNGLDLSLETVDIPVYITIDQQISGQVVNLGAETINTFTLHWQLDDLEVYQTEFNGLSLETGQYFNFLADDLLNASVGTHQLTVWIANVNGNLNDDNPSNDEIEITCQKPSQLVPKKPLFEEFHSSSCAPSASFNTQFNPFVQSNYADLTLIKYPMNWPGTGDPYYVPDCNIRRQYYQVNATPSMLLNGKIVGTSMTAILNQYDIEKELTTIATITAMHSVEGSIISVEAEITPYIDLSSVTFQIAVVENETTENAGASGQTSFMHTLMKMLPFGEGTPISLQSDIPFSFNIESDLTYTNIEDFEDLSVVVFLQDIYTREVYQSAYSSETTLYGLYLEETVGGQVSGGGYYEAGTEVTITATPNEGYEFVNWTQNSSIYSELPSFTITMPEEDIHLTANFMACAPDWIPNLNLQYNMQVIAQIVNDGEVSLNENDVLGAFVGDECRGIASPIPNTNGMIFLSVGSNETSGEEITLKIWNSSLCDFCEAGPGFTFENFGEVGSFESPLQVGCITDVDLTLSFGQGYTWFSENLAPEDAHPNMLFDGLSACNNDRLIGQSSFSVYFNGIWNGTITAMNPSYSYRMKLCEAQEFTATAPPAEMTPILLNAGYTWVGYLPQSCLPINDALANLDPAPTANDRLIGQSSFALYTGSNWIGTLTNLCPGAGYVIKLANASTLLYPQSSANSSMSKAISSELDSPTKVYPAKNLQHSMTILGQLELTSGHFSNNANDRIYAYINDQCVGMANPMKAENGLIFMSVGENSDEAQEVSFKIWLDEEQQLYDANEALTFVPLKGTGAFEAPFKFTIGKPVSSDSDWFIGEPYPNPFSEETIIPYTIKESTTVSATVYNSTGQQLYHWKQYVEQTGNHQIHIPKGQLSSGIYNVKILISNSNQLHQTSKIIIVM